MEFPPRPRQYLTWRRHRLALQADRGSRSWNDLVEHILGTLAASADDCRSQQISIAELNTRTHALLRLPWEMLIELRSGTYYGYRIGPKLFRKARGRILAAIAEAQSIGRARLADQSLQARGGEAQLSARHMKGTDKDAELSGLPRMHHFPIANGFAQDASGERVADYMTTDLHLNSPQHEWGDEVDRYDGLLDVGLLDVVETLASNKANLFKHPNPPGHIRQALNWEAKRRLVRHRKKWMPPTPKEAFGFCALKNPETQLNASIDWERGLAELGLSSDQIKALKAKFDGLGLRSPETAESLGLTPEQLERTRRLLCPDQKAGKALRTHFDAYNPTDDAK